MVLKASNGAIGSEADAFENLLFIDTLRGEDSTGLASFHKNGEVQILKEASAAYYFLLDKAYTDWRKDFILNGKAVIGHNRKRTQGEIKDENAHPFLIDNRYAFVHNGTLTNHKKLKDTEVDSEALGHHLCEAQGEKEKIETALADVWGAYACAWIDQDKEMLYIVRNKERPMYIAQTGCGFVFASELAFIYTACSRNRIKVEEVEEVPSDCLISIDLTKDHSVLSYKKEPLEIKKHYPSTKGTRGGRGDSTTGATTTTGSGDEPSEVSKNLFKKLKQNLRPGFPFTFWVDDYQNRGVESTKNEWLIFGESLSFPNKHIVKGFFKADSELEVKQLEGSLVNGLIESVQYDRDQKVVIIQVNNINKVQSSREAKTSLH